MRNYGIRTDAIVSAISVINWVVASEYRVKVKSNYTVSRNNVEKLRKPTGNIKITRTGYKNLALKVKRHIIYLIYCYFIAFCFQNLLI